MISQTVNKFTPTILKFGLIISLFSLLFVGCKAKKRIRYGSAQCGGIYDSPKNGFVKLGELKIYRIIQDINGLKDTITYPALEFKIKMPEYIQDTTNMSFESFFKKNFKYPEEARKFEITGRVLILIVVEENGDVSEVRNALPPERQLGYGLEEEAIRVLQLITKWKPGYLNDKPIRTTLMLPISCYVED